MLDADGEGVYKLDCMYLPVFTSIYLYLPVFTSIYQYLPVFTCIYLYLRVLTSIYLYLYVLGGDEPILSYEAVVQQECK